MDTGCCTTAQAISRVSYAEMPGFSDLFADYAGDGVPTDEERVIARAAMALAP